MPTTDDRTLIDHPLLSPAPTGRLIQGAFAVVFTAANILLIVMGGGGIEFVMLAASLTLVAAATAVAFSPALRGPQFHQWMVLVPLADFVAIGLLRMDQAGGVTNPMVMMLTLPAIWMGVIGGASAALALGAGTLLVVTPDLILLVGASELDATAQRTLMVITIFPVAMAFASAVAAALARTLRERQSQLVAEQLRRTEAAREIERGRRLLRETLDTLDVAVIITTPDGSPLLLNRTLRENPLVIRAGGDNAWDGFLAVPSFDFDTREPVSVDDTVTARMLRGDRVSDHLVWAGEPTTPQRALALSANAVHSDDGEHLANVIAIADVTSLVETLEVKKEFLAAVSHELRTPLTMLSGVIDLMRDDNLFPDDQTRGWIAVMERNIHRQRRLVDDLLMVASADRATLSVRARPGMLATLARDAIAAIGPEADRKNITVSWQGDEAAGVFDPDRMGQVCDNLITNAVRHSEAGSAVTVVTRTDGDELVLRVQDTGRGMSDDELSRAFDRFYRSTASAEAAVPGTGLGLPIVKLIADAHGGTVTLASTPGHGLTATVVIPRSPHSARTPTGGLVSSTPQP
jgi:signal transduction histidine kinase/PAS domain-containing protein